MAAVHPSPRAQLERSPLGRPARVVIGRHQHKNLFDLISDPRLEVHHTIDPALEPDLIVFPSTSLEVAGAAEGLPAQWWARIAKGDAGIVFESSYEGYPDQPGQIEPLYRFLGQKGIPPERCAYVTQNRAIGDYYDRTFTGPRMRSIIYDYWVRRLFRVGEAEGEKHYRKRLKRFKRRTGQRPRRFISFNRSLRFWKVVFLLRLLEDGLWNTGFVSVGGFEEFATAKGADEAERIAHFRHRLERELGEPGLMLGRQLSALAAKGQVLFGMPETTDSGLIGYLTAAAPLDEYDLSWFSATTETEMSPAGRHVGERFTVARVTEKSFKAFANFHAQIVLGNRGALELLRQFGFQTFDRWIDESYDLETDPRRRFELAYAQVRRLCEMDEADLAAMEREMAAVLIENARWSWLGLPRRYREELDPRFITELLSLLD